MERRPAAQDRGQAQRGAEGPAPAPNLALLAQRTRAGGSDFFELYTGTRRIGIVEIAFETATLEEEPVLQARTTVRVQVEEATRVEVTTGLYAMQPLLEPRALERTVTTSIAGLPPQPRKVKLDFTGRFVRGEGELAGEPLPRSMRPLVTDNSIWLHALALGRKLGHGIDVDYIAPRGPYRLIPNARLSVAGHRQLPEEQGGGELWAIELRGPDSEEGPGELLFQAILDERGTIREAKLADGLSLRSPAAARPADGGPAEPEGDEGQRGGEQRGGDPQPVRRGGG